MAIDTTPYEFHDQPRSAPPRLLGAIVLMLVLVLATTAAWRSGRDNPVVGKADPCESPACVSPRQIIAAHEARRIKRELGSRALLVDIRADAEAPAGLAIGSDVQVPFMEPISASAVGKGAENPPMQFRIDFSSKMDEALQAAHMHHDEHVILMAPSTERAILAALLLQEWGYTRILVVDN